MFRPSIRLCTVAALPVPALSATPISAQTGPAPASPVTVVLEVALAANAAPSEALAASNEVRALMKRQLGFLPQEFLQNLGASPAPRHGHVSRWASKTCWAGMFQAPEFTKLGAHGNEQHPLSACAVLAAA